MTTDITKVLRQEYDALSRHYTILGVFLCGSQNYGLATEESDIDTKIIIAPSFRDLIFEAPVSRTVALDCGECDVKDIREMIKNYKKQNVNFIETLFTDYRLLSPGFKYAFDELYARREQIAHMDERRAVRAMAGLVDQSFRRMLTETDKKVEDIREYGYHRKNLMNCVKAAAMLDKYIAGEKYEAVLDCSKYAHLRSSILPSSKAIQMAEELMQRSKDMADIYIKERNPQPDKKLSVWLDNWLYDLIRGCVEY